MSALSGPEQKEESTIEKRTDHRKALDRRRFVRDCPSPRLDLRRLVVCSPRSWSELRELVEVWSSPLAAYAAETGAFAARTGAFVARTRKVDFFLSNHHRFRSNLLGHAPGLDHSDVLLTFRANVLKHAKTEGFFQQREVQKTDTAREVCVATVAQIAVTYTHTHTQVD